MAIRGKTPKVCFDKFVGHLNPLIHATLPTRVPLEVETRQDRTGTATLAFRGVYTIPLRTRRGVVHFHLGQLLQCSEDKKRGANERFHLSTRKYWYRVQADPNHAPAILRWEYISPKMSGAEDRHCWRHLQMPHELEMPAGTLDLDKAHLPTGYVFIEDVIRFLIDDLGVKPPCGGAWHRLLVDSEKKFHDEFNTKIKGA
jgi:hypothetical protein